jgi:hypothetical protein
MDYQKIPHGVHKSAKYTTKGCGYDTVDFLLPGDIPTDREIQAGYEVFI